MAEPWASIDDVAAHLGVRRDSVYRWIERHGLPATKIGKLWRMKLSEVDTWMRRRSTESNRTASAAPRGHGRRLDEREKARVVLIVEDDELVSASTADFLTDRGYRVLVASNGEEALKLLASSTPRPSLILLDLSMPKLDGWQLRKEQLRDPALAAIPVVVVTATPTTSVEGARALLRKPLRLPLLAKAIASLFEEEGAWPR